MANLHPTRHYTVLRQLGLSQWSNYDAQAMQQDFELYSPRHLKQATYNISGLPITCAPGVYHPDVNSSSIFILRHLMDKRLFPPNAKVLDVGTGCGAIILGLSQLLHDGTLTGIDIDPLSVACARENAQLNNINAQILQSDLFDGVPGQRYDVVIFNAPLYAAPTNNYLAPELTPKLCDYGGQLLAKFIEQLPIYLEPEGYAYLLVSNTGELAALDQNVFNIELIACERFANGFFRALTKLSLRQVF